MGMCKAWDGFSARLLARSFCVDLEPPPLGQGGVGFLCTGSGREKHGAQGCPGPLSCWRSVGVGGGLVPPPSGKREGGLGARQVQQLERSIGLKDLAMADLEQKVLEMEASTYDGVFIWKISDFARKRQEAVAGRTPAIFSPGVVLGPLPHCGCCLHGT